MMKKWIIVLFGIVSSVLLANSCRQEKIDFPKKILEQYDVDQRVEIYKAWEKVDPNIGHIEWLDSLKYLVYISPNLQIKNIFTGEEVDNILEDIEEFGIYTINYLRGGRQLLLCYKEKFTVITLGNYPKAIKKVLSFFKRYDDLDKRLLPLCIQEMTKIYVDNSRQYHEFGPWRHWWGEEADSLGKIYNQYLQYR